MSTQDDNRRRLGPLNAAVLVVLLLLVCTIFAVTVVKLSGIGPPG